MQRTDRRNPDSNRLSFPTSTRRPEALRLPWFLHIQPRRPPPFTMSRARKSPVSPARPAVSIDGVIHTIRGERVILDADLARIYGVKTKVLNQAVRRNREKFPSDFLRELTNAEAVNIQRTRKPGDTILRSQIVTLKRGQHLKHLPFAFTEHGALMAANILNSP